MTTSRLYAFHCGGVRSFRGFYDVTDPNPTDLVYEPFMFFLIEHGDARILFDTGMNPRWIRADDGGVGELMVAAADTLPSKLAEVDLTPGDIDAVVVSHLHIDHAGGLEFLGDTPVYVNRDELPFARTPPVYQEPLYDREDFSGPIAWVEVDGEYDVVGDGRITILPTPGHTPGHQALRVRLASGTYVLCADASYLASKMREGRIPGVVWNPDRLVDSWLFLEDLERSESAHLLFTHDLDFRESKRLAPRSWYE